MATTTKNPSTLNLEAQYETCTRDIIHTPKQQELYNAALDAVRILSAICSDPAHTESAMKDAEGKANEAIDDLNELMAEDHVNDLLDMAKEQGAEAAQRDWLNHRFVPKYTIKAGRKKSDPARSLAFADKPMEIALQDLVNASLLSKVEFVSKADWYSRLLVFKENLMAAYGNGTFAKDSTMEVPVIDANTKERAMALGEPYWNKNGQGVSKNALNDQLKDIYESIFLGELQTAVKPSRKILLYLAADTVNSRVMSGTYYKRSNEEFFTKRFIGHMWNRYMGIELSCKDDESTSTVSAPKKAKVESESAEGVEKPSKDETPAA